MTMHRFDTATFSLTVLVLSAMMMVFAINAEAQSSTGMVVGTVTDKTSAVIRGATVTLTNKATNIVQTTETAGAGVFRFAAVLAGDYQITVDCPGFRKEQLDNLVVTVGQTTSVQLLLEVGGQTQTVQISAEDLTSLQAESSQVQTVVTSRDVANLPLNGRDFIQLEALQPNSVPFERTSSSANRGGYNMIAGTPAQADAMTIDGVNVKEILDPRTTILMNIDAIQEFQSASSNYSAAEGGAGGGQVNLVTKPGTNTFHGSLFEYVRNNIFDARNYFNPVPEAIPGYRQNQFGGTIGGKIIRDKLFFFGGYEGLRIAQSLSQFYTVPTLSERQGNFQNEGEPQIYNPLGYNASTGTRSPFVNNIIPSGMISQTSLAAIKALFPSPNLPGVNGANDLSGAAANSQTTDQFSIRGDYNPTSKDTYFLRYIYFNPRKLIGADAALPNFLDIQNTPTHSVALGYTRTITPRLLNNFRLGYLRFTQLLEDPDIAVPIDQQIGITGTSTVFLGNPYIHITGIDTTGGESNSPNNRRDDSYYLYDDVLLNAGKHGLSMGFTANAQQFNGGQNPYVAGEFSFTNQYTEQIGKSSTGFALADFMLGFPATSEVGLGTGFRNWRMNQWATYLQDDWKFTPDLTLNMGLRYEYSGTQYPTHNDVSGFIPVPPEGEIVTLGVNGVPRGLRNPYHKDFEPRVGFAYRPGASTRLVIRSGYGMTFYPLQFYTPAFSMCTNPPNFLEESFVGTTPIPNLTLTDAFPAGLGTTSETLTTIAQNFRDSYIQQWNLAIEREIGANTTIDLMYLGNKGSRLAYTENINASPAGPGNVQAKRPFPDYSAITSVNSFASSTYQSGVIKAQRLFSHGLTFLASYTFAKSLATPDESLVGDGASSVSVRNPLDPQADKGRDVFDIRQRLTGDVVWDLPIGRGQLIGKSWPRYMEQTLGSWRFNAILNMMTGYPAQAQLGLDNANTGDSSQSRPNVIGNPNDGPRTVKEWFNTAAFVLPPQYSYGDEGTNIIDGPPQRELDISLSKEWPIFERAKFQFRADWFSVTNTPQFNQPGLTWGTSTFGVISSGGDPREAQFAGRVEF